MKNLYRGESKHTFGSKCSLHIGLNLITLPADIHKWPSQYTFQKKKKDNLEGTENQMQR